MKKLLALLIISISTGLQAQETWIRFPNGQTHKIDLVKMVTPPYDGDELTEFELKRTKDPLETSNVKLGGESLGSLKSDGAWYKFSSADKVNLIDKTIAIVHPFGTADAFTIPSKDSDDEIVEFKSEFPKITAQQRIGQLFPEMIVKPYGIIIPTSSSTTSTAYKGDNFVHIFYDQNGGLLLSTVPQGISNKQYVVHVIYMTDKDQPTRIDYSIEQTAGEYSDALVFWNDGQLSTFQYQSGKNEKIIYEWKHKEQLLSTSTSDIKFNLYRNVITAAEPFTIDKKLMASGVIKMSKVYHGSFNIGIVNSRLSNPTFTMVESPWDSSQYVVKQSESGSRIVITGMATFYASPVIWFEKLILRREIASYKLTGRNFLDDHKIYERIYPVVGLSLDNHARQNLFYGMNWEFARGGAIYFGVHYGRVNTFDTSGDFVIGSTPITQRGFDFRNGTKMQADWAFGFNLDLIVVRNLLRQTK